MDNEAIAGFRRGLVDALPVFVGYFSVGFTFGIAAMKSWDSLLLPALASMTHLSGTGQFVLVSLGDAGSSVAAILSGIVAINLRYTPMALSISQRLAPETSIPRRLAIALGITDEIVGISLGKRPPLPFGYMMGLTLCSWLGWTGGTLAGVNPATRSLMSGRLADALGIAFPAMFAAIVFPAVRDSRRICCAVALAAAASVLLRLVPMQMDSGWLTLVSGIFAALVAAIIFPEKAMAASSPEGGDAA